MRRLISFQINPSPHNMNPTWCLAFVVSPPCKLNKIIYQRHFSHCLGPSRNQICLKFSMHTYTVLLKQQLMIFTKILILGNKKLMHDIVGVIQVQRVTLVFQIIRLIQYVQFWYSNNNMYSLLRIVIHLSMFVRTF